MLSDPVKPLLFLYGFSVPLQEEERVGSRRVAPR